MGELIKNMNNDLEQLKLEVADLKAWKAKELSQQFTYPLDTTSQSILHKYTPNFLYTINYVGPTGGEVPLVTTVEQNGLQYFLTPTNPVFQYTANPTTDYITFVPANVAGPFQGFSFFQNNTTVNVYSDNTIPAGLTSGATYYVINRTGNSFQLSLTNGGAAVNITTTGTGNQYITPESIGATASTITCNSGYTTRNLGAANGTQTIAHGLSGTPSLVRVRAQFGSGSGASVGLFSEANGVGSNGTFSVSYSYIQSSSNSLSNYGGTGNAFIVYTSPGSGIYATGTLSVDSTNISIAWVGTGGPSGTATIIWEAIL